MPSSRFSGFLQVLISHASKMRLLRQFVLVRRIFADSPEMVWPECKQCSAKADLCECFFSIVGMKTVLLTRVDRKSRGMFLHVLVETKRTVNSDNSDKNEKKNME